jgi:nitrate/nitrite transporter NarK
MFTPYERRQLRMIEQWFEEDDPQLANALRTGPVRHGSTVPQTVLIVLACALGALGVVTGAFMLIFAAAVAGVVAACMVSNRRAKLRS